MSRTRQASARLADRASLFAALGDQVRLRLVARLAEAGPLSITRLTDGEAVTRQAVTKHLRTLENAGLLSSSRSGRECIWELRPARLTEVQRHLNEISRQWDRALLRLQDLVERS